MKGWTCRSGCPEDTLTLGKTLGRHLKAGHVLCMTGTLGSGKTTLTQGITEGIRGESKGVRSPSFTLVNEYSGPIRVYHVDLYRLESSEEISELGLDEVLGSREGHQSGVIIVEWGEKLGPLAPKDRLDVHLKVDGPEEREIRFEAQGPEHNILLDAVRGALRDL